MRQKLLDLTHRNRLLNYKESVRSIRIIDELPDEVFSLLVSDGKGMEFLPIPESQEQKENQEQPPLLSTTTPSNVQKNSIQQDEVDRRNELPDPTHKKKRHQDTRLQTPFTAQLLERRCKRLLNESRTAIEETGSNLLHLAIGFLEWYEDDTSTEINRAPLILVPVQIERTRINRSTNCYTYAISYNDEDIETNISLAEKLDHDFDLILPEFGEEITPESYLAKVKKMIKNKPHWRVAREMVLGLFSFSKILMYKDLDNDKWPDKANLTDHKNVTQILVGKEAGLKTEDRIYGEEYVIDLDPRANKIPLILDADSSQHSAIVDAFCKEENLVIDGPPGTGESQTIANLIAAALIEGKTVLFVAEKKMDSKNVEVVSQLNTSIVEFRQLMNDAEEVIKGIEPLSVEKVKSLANAVSTLETIGYADNTPAELTKFAELLKAVHEAIYDIETLGEVAHDIMLQAPATFSDFLRIINIGDVIKNAPEDITVNHHPEHKTLLCMSKNRYVI